MKTTSKRLAFAAAFGLICLAPAALAQTPTAAPTVLPSTSVSYANLPSIKVSYADLDVSSETGMGALAIRISTAVRLVCWQSNHPRELEDVYQCRNQARRDAWQQFGRNQERAGAARAPMLAASRTDTN
ncbi:MAG: UrcA family protein [Brevundimonas sp.]